MKQYFVTSLGGLMVQNLSLESSTKPGTVSMSLRFCMLSALLLCFAGNASAQTVFDSLWVTDGTVHTAVVSGNTIYIGGTFTYVGPNTGRGAAIDMGTAAPDLSFPKVNGTIYAVVSDGSGGWYIGGDFTSVGGITRNRIAHILPNKTVNASWDPNANSTVWALAVSGTTVYAGGEFTTIGGQPRNRIAALDASTGLATGWDPNASGSVRALALSGTTVYAGGEFTSIGGQTRNRIAALDASTGLATTWDPNADGTVFALAVSGTTVYAGGDFTTIGGQPRNRIAALDASTGSATSWDPNASGTVQALAVSGTTVYAGGFFTSIGGQTRNYIAALDASTGLATGWDPNASGSVRALAISGTTVYAGGFFTSIGGQPRNRIAALDASTGLATGWDPNASGTVWALALSGTTVYAGGSFTSIGGQTRNRIAALDASTGSATSWDPNASGTVQALAVSGTTVYAGGFFTSIGGQTRNRIAALDASTGLATGWDPNASGTVLALALSGTTVYAGGDFTTIGGQPRNRIAALDASTGLATTWDPNASGTVRALALSGTTVYAGGDFTSIGGQPRNRIAALDASTGLATGWDPNASATVFALAVSGTTVYAGGSFTSIGGQTRNRIAALDASTGSATTWDPNASGPVRALALDFTKARVYAGGSFTTVLNDARSNFVGLRNPDDTALGAPAAPTLALPSNGATGVATNPTLSWNASTGAASYRLQVSTSSTFSTTVHDQSGITGTSQQVSGLANNTLYYWRVNATNVGGTSDWSTTWSFTTIVAAPAAPTLASPSNGATGVATNPTLSWNASTGAASYRLQVSTSSTFSTTVYDQSGITGTSQQVSGLANNTLYYWRVNATNAGGTSDWSTTWSFTTIVAPPSGSGTAADPYLIATLNDLLWITANISSWNAHFKQTANIDASPTSSWTGGGWTPIGNPTTAFTGAYNGQGYVIDGLYINRNSSFQGLFGAIKQATISNLGVTNVNIIARINTGSLAGRVAQSTINNCYSTGTVNGSGYVGGLVGEAVGSSITNCYSSCNVSGTAVVGGLVGANVNTSVINNSYSTGAVAGNEDVGGLTGFNGSGSSITNCYSRGNVVRNSGTQTRFGGFVGNNSGTIQYCYSTGSVNFGTAQGFVGASVDTPTYTANFFDSQTSGQSSGTGATAITTAQMKTALTFIVARWSTTVWNIGDGLNDGYPYLDWQNPSGTSLYASAGLTPPSGSGTAADPYLIATLNDLLWITANTSSWNAHFKQTANINAAATSGWVGGGWPTIGNGTTKFTGSYDGQGFTIDALYINRSAGQQGLFGWTLNATVRNVRLTNVNITGTVDVGALVGVNENSVISGCSSSGTVSGAIRNVGGLAGQNYTNSTINTSYSLCTTSGTEKVGGLVGWNRDGATIDNSYSRGGVTRASGSNTEFGGFVGNNAATIRYSYSTGSVSFGTAQGFVGASSGTPTYTANFFDSQTSGHSSGIGATAKTTAEMKRGYTFLTAGWNPTVWFRNNGTNNDYPYLAWENPAGTPLQWPQIAVGSGNSQSSVINTALANPLVVTVTDENTDPVRDVPVTFAIATTPASATGQNLSVTSATTDASGQASTALTLGNKVGAYTVTATSASLTGSPVTFTANATTGAATTIALTSGSGQSAAINTALTPFVVTVTDAGGNPVSSVNVTWSITGTPTGATGQSLSSTSSTSDANGRASTILTLGNKSGTYTVTATSGTLAGSPVSFTATATAGAAATIALTSGNNQSKTHSTALDNPFIITVTDSNGNVVSGTNVTFAIATTPANATGQALSVTNTTTDANGRASTLLTLGNKAGTYTVTATSGTLAGSPVTFTASATAGAAVAIALTSGNNQSAPIASALANPFVLTVTDAGGNPVQGVSVNWSITGTPTGATGQSLSSTSSTSDANGRASTILTLGNKVGTYAVHASSTGLTGSPISFTATATVGAAANIALTSGNGQSATINTTLSPFVVTVTDAGGNPVQGVSVTWSITGTPSGATGQSLSSTSSTSDANGQASTTLTLGNKVGTYTVQALSTGLTGSPITFTATATVGAAANIALTSGNGQSATINTTLSPFVVTVTDAGGNPVQGVSVNWSITGTPTGATGQSLSSTSSTSDANGRASTILTLGNKVGTYAVHASSTGLTGSPISFTATATVGAAANIALTSGNGQSATINTTLSPFVVTVTDAGGNPVQGVSVNWSITGTPTGATGQSLSNTSSTSDANGRASTILTLGNKVGTYTVHASSTVLTGSRVTFTATATVGAAANIALTSGNGQSATINTTLSPFVVTVTDAGGNPVQGVSVTWSITGTPTGATGQSLSSTSSTSDANGRASTILTLGNKVGTYTVHASSTGLTGSSITFTATATVGAAANIALTSGNGQSATINTTLSPFVVTVTDAGGNPVQGVSVNWSITNTPSGATGQSLNAASTTTDVKGEASVTFTLGNKVGTYTVQATLGNVTGSPVSFSATATTGAATTVLPISGTPQSGTILTTLPQALVVTVFDVGSNPVPNVAVNWSVQSKPVEATGEALSSSTSTTGSNGQTSATFILGNKVGTYVVRASVGGLRADFTLWARAGAVASLTKVSGDNQIGPIQTQSAQPFVVALRDAGNNPVSGMLVTFSLVSSPPGPTGAGLSSPSVTTADNGEAQTYLVFGSKVGNYVVSAAVSGLPAVLFTGTAIAGAASQMLKVSGENQSGSVNSRLSQPLVVQVTDRGGNPISGVRVSFAFLSTPAGAMGQELTPLSAVTNEGGEAQTTLKLGSLAGQYQVQASSPQISGVSVVFTASAIGPTSVEALPGAVPSEFALQQNYPNPFNPSTRIRFSIPEESRVRLVVYSLLGVEVAALVDEELRAGVYETVWNAGGRSSGAYFVRMEAFSRNGDRSFSLLRRMMLVK